MVVGMFFVGDENFVVVLITVHPVDLPCVAFIIKNWYVGYDLIDAFFSQEICLICLHLQNGSLLFRGEYHVMFWVNA
jgi:hypothetical protein